MLQTRQHQAEPRAFAREGFNPRARRMRLRVIAWLAGVGGFVGLLMASRYLPHPDTWRAVALVWFLAAGVLNTYFVLKRD